MANNDTIKKLEKLFSSNIIVKRIGKNKIKVVDTQRSQSIGSLASTRSFDRYSKLHTSRRFGHTYGEWHSQNYNMMRSRQELYTDYECVSGDTIIPTPDGNNFTIKQLSEMYPDKENNFYVYSYDINTNTVKLGVAHSVRKTKTDKTFKITFDGGKNIIATDNHPFLMRDGQYKKVKDLKVDDSVMLFRQLKKLNCKIIKIEDYDIIDVYDMTVEDYHNFATDSCFIHNSMDQDPIISSALDIYAEESTTRSENGDLITIKTDSKTIKDILENLFYDILNIDFNLFNWIRATCKYGDYYLIHNIKEGVGIVSVSPRSAYSIKRIEETDDGINFDIKFIDESEGGVTYYEEYEISHFRMLTDPNYLPYGKSMLEGARKIWKQLILMEDAMLIHRIMRAPERRIFKINVGNLPPKDIDAYMNKVVEKTKKIPFMDQQTGDYNLKFNLMNMLEDYYVPIRGDAASTDIDTLQGMEFGGIDDIEYLKNKMMAALKIPKAFIGYEEGIEGKSTLSMQDVRFARTVERIQRIILSELYKIAIIHLVVQGFEGEELLDFDLELTNPSIIFQQEKVELLSNKIGTAADMLESKLFSRDYIYEHLYDMPKQEYEEQKDKVIQDSKEKFRLEQIEGEGNDPVKSGATFGTRHDLALLALSKREKGYSPEVEDIDSGWPNKKDVGRPSNTTSQKYETDENPFGRDPLGRYGSKDYNIDKSSIKHHFKQNSPLAAGYSRSGKQINEQINEDILNKEDNKLFEGTFLDDSVLLDENSKLLLD